MDWKQQQISLFKQGKSFEKKMLDHHLLRLEGDKVVSSHGAIFPNILITKTLNWFDNDYSQCKTCEEMEESKKRAPKLGRYKVEHATHYSLRFGCLDLRLNEIREIAEEMKNA